MNYNPSSSDKTVPILPPYRQKPFYKHRRRKGAKEYLRRRNDSHRRKLVSRKVAKNTFTQRRQGAKEYSRRRNDSQRRKLVSRKVAKNTFTQRRQGVK